MRAVLLVFLLVACGDNNPGNINITTPEAFEPAIGEFAKHTPYPLQINGADGGFQIVLEQHAELPAESYQLHTVNDTITVAAPDVLGAQYGTAAALESLGFRFRHPYDAFVPTQPKLTPADDAVHSPHTRVRGVHLHTLHPIESHFAFWDPGKGSTIDAHRIVDWVIKNRGNYIQWAALDNILDPAVYAEWHDFTRELIDYAHARGIRVGLNFQLFGASNLQLAFDLVDDAEMPIEPQLAERLPLLTKDLPFDVYDVSFGEFFDADPQLFIDSLNATRAKLTELAPQAEMHALVHVGATQLVTYMGQQLLYYFLVKFADPSIIPDVHSVMFYDLFEPTGGAYQHEDFSEHRQYLLERMCNHQPVAYHPETAYWVAFDNSVPQLFPLYVHNRWLDLEQLDAQNCGPLDNHLMFSSGWEWGYWLNDVTTLRATYERPPSPTAAIAAELGPVLADQLAQLIDLQRRYVMMGRLVGYLAGRDTAIDAGRQLGIVSQPDRVTFDDLVAGADRGAFDATVMQPLADYADALDHLSFTTTDDRWGREFADGLAIDRLRTRYVLALYAATLAHLDGDDAEATRALARADAVFAEAQTVVARRHADLHDDHGRRLVDPTTNHTFYQFGYLFMADTLCYWNRERVQVAGILGSSSAATPSCLF